MSGTENSSQAPKKRSRTRWLLVWTTLGVVSGAVAYLREPPLYEASTSILIVPQRIPARMVPPTMTLSIVERLNMISQQILSRTRLETIIKEFNLYEVERRKMIMEDIIDQMRIDISIMNGPRGDEDVQSFVVSFTSTDARKAMQVTERLASLFVQEHLEDRELLADQTALFFQAQVEDTGRRLWESDGKLRAMKRRGLALSVLTAEHDVLVETYKQVLAHSEAARISLQLERRQIGEQFKVIDGARLPEKPISPRVFPYLALGALAGLGAGLAVSLLMFAWRRRRPRTVAAA